MSLKERMAIQGAQMEADAEFQRVDELLKGRDDIRFRNGGRVLLALALWDGSNRDKNANKMVSPWRLLEVK